MSIRVWGKALRVHQWVKNAFVFAPAIFSKHLMNASALDEAFAMCVAFCLASSAVYLVNDTLDIAADRNHPTKRHRPIAAGRITTGAARRGAALLAAVGLATAALIAPAGAAMIGLYLAIGLAYSWRLKHVAVVDALVISCGFLLRVLAGGYAVRVAVSPWLLGCTGLLALLLGLGKRAHELTWHAHQPSTTTRRDTAATRAALDGYELGALRAGLWGLAAITVGVYAAYTRAPGTIALFGTTRLWWTIPLPALGIARFLWLTADGDNPASPTETMLRDPWLLACVAGWGSMVVWLVYGGR